jgi:hypothetical protein
MMMLRRVVVRTTLFPTNGIENARNDCGGKLAHVCLIPTQFPKDIFQLGNRVKRQNEREKNFVDRQGG